MPPTQPPISVQSDIGTKRQLQAFNPAAGALTYQLPKAADFKGWTMVCKHDSPSTNAVTLLPTGIDTLDGQTSSLLANPRSSKIFVSNGINRWMLVAEYAGV